MQTIQDYLVSLGWHIDQKSFADFNKVLEKTEQKVFGLTETFNKALSGIAKNHVIEGLQKKLDKHLDKIKPKIETFFMTTRGLVLTLTTAIISAIAAIAIAITAATYKFMANMAKADMSVQIFARRMLTTVENARSLKAVMDAMGVGSMDELNDVALNPELRAQFLELRRISSDLGLDNGSQKGMQNIRKVEYEFQKLNLIMNYFWQTLAGQLGTILEGPLNSFQKALANIAEFLKVNMAPLAHDLGGILAIISKVVWLISRLSLVLLHIKPGNLNGLLNLFGALLDIINGVLDGLNSILDIVDDVSSSANSFSAEGLLGSAQGGDRYHEGQDSLKSLSHYVQRIYELLSQAWNWIINHFKGLADFVKKPIEKTIDTAKNLIKGVSDFFGGAEANASTSGLSNDSSGGGPSKGRLLWGPRNKDRHSVAIDGFMSRLSTRLSETFYVTAGMTEKNHVSHSDGTAFDIGLGGKSTGSIVQLMKAALATPGLGMANLEISLPAYYKVLHELDRQGVKYQGRVKNQWGPHHTGDNLHIRTQPIQVSIHVHGGQDPQAIAQACYDKFRSAAYNRNQMNGGVIV